MNTSDVLLIIRSRLNRDARLQSLAWGLAIGGGLLLAASLACVLQGYPVLWWCYALGAAACGLTFGICYLRKRRTLEDAARFADSHFDLKDTLTSDLHFQTEHRSGEFFDLVRKQASATADRISGQSIALPLPGRLLALGCVLVLAGFSLSFRSPSPEVIKRWQQEAETQKKTAEVNEEIKKQLDELMKGAHDGDDPALADLKKLAAELRQTKDMKEAMRQYAELERRIADQMQRMNRREQEELLRQAGEALQQDPANRQLGQQLANKQFAEAAQQLAAMQPKIDAANPDQSRQAMEKLRSAAQRMGQVAKDAMQRRQQSSGESGQQSQSELAQNMAALDDATRKLDESLRQAQQLQKQNASDQQRQQNQQQQKQAQSQCQQCMSQMQKQLSQCQQCRNMAQKLSKLSQCMSQCQSYMNGQCQSCQANKPGGKKAGTGTVESRRDGSDPLPFTNDTLEIQGQKGQGPSEKTIEAADSGDRTGSRRAGARERSYQKQAESFVNREDVPAEVREGVKNYFRTIQDKPEEKPKEEPATPEAPKLEAQPKGPKKAAT